MTRLLKEIRENKDIRKIFGVRELKIIEKQLLGINLTQSEKNRLSRDIRRKFEVIKKLSIFDDEFDLKKGSEIKEIVYDIKEEILKSTYFPNIKKILLFGSSVNNERTFRSDIDIAVEFYEITNKEAFDFRKKILGKVSENADIQVFNLLPEKIKKSI